MKKILTISAVLIATAFISSTAFARWGGNMDHGGIHSATITSDQQAFDKNTIEIRATLTADRAELSAILAKNNPDSAQIKALSLDIVKQNDELRKQAEKYNVKTMGMGQGNCGEYGHGHMMNY
ncbi:MAG: hypothetical protein M0Z56_11810 [Desulfobacteraceae bacterium]|nr:hypothetical protein [Desulfobacteraceae bacterium]